MALSSVILVRVLGNTSGLRRSLKRAQDSLGGLERISRGITGGMGLAAKATAILGAAAVAAGVTGAASLGAIPAVIGAIAVAATTLGAFALTGVSAGFLGIGIAAAATTKRVKKAFGGLGKFIKKRLRGLAEPLVGPLVTGADRIRAAFQRLAPALSRIFEMGVPLVRRFFAQLQPIADRIAPALVDTFKAGRPVLMAFINGMQPLAQGFVGFFNALSNQGPSFTRFARILMRGIGEMLPALGRFLGALAPIGVRIVRNLLPALSDLFGLLARKVGPAFKEGLPILRAFGSGLKQLGGGLGGFFGELKASTPVFVEFIGTLFSNLAKLLPALGRLVVALAPIGTAVLSTVLPALTTLADFLAANVGPVFDRVTTFFREHTTAAKAVGLALIGLVVTVKALQLAMSIAAAATLLFTAVAKVVRFAIIVWKNAQLALNLAMIANPIGLVIAAIVALVAVFVIAYKKSETFRRIVDAAWAAIKRATVAVWEFLKDLTLEVWSAIKGAATSAVNGVKSAVTSAWNAIRSATSAVWNGIKSLIGAVAGFIAAVVRTNVNIVRSVISSTWEFVTSATTRVWNGLKSIVSTAIAGVMSVVRGIKSKVLGAFAAAGSWLFDAGRNIIQGLINGIKNMAGAAVGAAKGVVGGAIKGAKSLLGISSPSKVFARIGEQTGAGFVQGLVKSGPKIRRALDTIGAQVREFAPLAGGTLRVRAEKFATPGPTVDPMEQVIQLLAQLLFAINRLPAKYRMNEQAARS